MMRLTVRLASLAMCVFGLLLCPAAWTAAADRFAGMLQDGQRISANDFANWQDPAQTPTLAGKNLFDPGNPIRWIVDTTRPQPLSPPAYVEFYGGDRLPGEVIGFRTGGELPADQSLPHLIVQTESDFGPQDSGARDVVRVGVEWVQRVVWQATPGREYRPGTVFLKDGRALSFRSIRWGESIVTLLTDQGITTVSVPELAEIHSVRRNPWEAWFEQLAALAPSGQGRLICEEATDGARITTSLERFRPQFRGDRNKMDSWVHVMQPAWSLDPLWVKFSTVARWRSFAPHQAPLSMAFPAEVKQQSIFATGSRWQLDRSVQGQPLRSNGLEFGWGFGVPARNELTFELPRGAKSFRTSLALDDSAGDGGCVRGFVFLETGQRRAIYQSEILVGSKKVLDSGILALPGGASQARLVLVADPVIEGRPAGADPFDIRDTFNWLLPEIEFDPQIVQQEVARHAFARVAAFSEWTLSQADAAKCRIVNHWDESHPRDARYRMLLTADAPFIAMSRKMRIANGQKWLAVSTTRPPTRTTPVCIQVRVDGVALSEFEVPAHASPTPPDPVLVPIGEYQGKSVTVEVVQIPEKPDGAVDWRAVAPVDRWPGLFRVFEDEADFVAALTDGAGEATVVESTPYRGKAALRVTPTGRGNAKIPGLSLPIREYPEFGEYRYLRFVWKLEESSQVILGLGHNGEFGGDGRKGRGRPGARVPGRSRRSVAVDDRGMQVGYRYDAGKGPPPPGGAIRLGGPESNWVEVTRDLYADMGNFTLTGLNFGCLDGNAAWFDHIYLGRTLQDLESIKELFPAETPPPATPPDPNIAQQTTDRTKFGQILKHVAPLFSTMNPGDGLTLLKEKQGRKNVVRTLPPENKTPCILRTVLNVPAGRLTTLELGTGHEPKGDWMLVVTANGQTIHEGIVNESTSKEGWLDLNVQLSRFAGQSIVLTVEQRMKDARHPAYWSKVAVQSR